MPKLREKQEEVLKVIEDRKVITTDELMELEIYHNMQSLHTAIVKLIYRGYKIEFIPLKKTHPTSTKVLYFIKGEEKKALERLYKEYLSDNIDDRVYSTASRKLKNKLNVEREERTRTFKLTDFI